MNSQDDTVEEIPAATLRKWKFDKLRKKQADAKVKLEFHKAKKEEQKVLPSNILQEPNSGNGGEEHDYTWGQTLDEVSVTVELPPHIKSHMLDVKLSYNEMHIKYKNPQDGSEPLVQGKWRDNIDIDETYWSIEKEAGKSQLTATVAKKKGTTWWKSLLEGDIEIDTKKCKIGKVQLSDLSPDVRASMERKLYDEHRELQGLSTSQPKHPRELLKHDPVDDWKNFIDDYYDEKAEENGWDDDEKERVKKEAFKATKDKAPGMDMLKKNQRMNNK